MSDELLVSFACIVIICLMLDNVNVSASPQLNADHKDMSANDKLLPGELFLLHEFQKQRTIIGVVYCCCSVELVNRLN